MAIGRSGQEWELNRKSGQYTHGRWELQENEEDRSIEGKRRHTSKMGRQIVGRDAGCEEDKSWS